MLNLKNADLEQRRNQYGKEDNLDGMSPIKKDCI